MCTSGCVRLYASDHVGVCGLLRMLCVWRSGIRSGAAKERAKAMKDGSRTDKEQHVTAR
mgnify:CR=1 FL=1